MQVAARQMSLPFFSRYLDYLGLDRYLRGKLETTPGIAVIKVHSPAAYAMSLIRRGVAKSVCTIRDPRDCVASRQLFEDESFDASVQFIESNLRYVQQYEQAGTTFFVRYEEMMRRPRRHIVAIAGYLGVTLSEGLLETVHHGTSMETARQVSDGLSARDAGTLLQDRSHLVDPLTNIHENHIHGGICGRWETELSPAQKRLLQSRWRPWLIRLGYERGSDA